MAGWGHAWRGAGLRIRLAVLTALFVWASAPGRSPSLAEEALLSPLVWAGSLPLLAGAAGAPAAAAPSPAEQEAWRGLRRRIARETRPPGGGDGVVADVLARYGPKGRTEVLLLSVSYAAGRVEAGDPCLAGGVLVGVVDPPPPGAGGTSGLARLRLLTALETSGPEPLRLEVRLGEGPGGGVPAIAGPGREEDPFPLRLHHVAALEKPAAGLKAFSRQGVGTLARLPAGHLVGLVRESPERPDLRFLAPALAAEAVHAVWVPAPAAGAVAQPGEAGPLARGRLVPARLSWLPDGDLRGRSFLLHAGALRGVRPGAAVVAGWTLLGQVAAVGPWHCRAVAPGDPGFRLRVLAGRPGPAGAEPALLLRGRLQASPAGGEELLWIPDWDGGPLRPGDRLWTAPTGLDLPLGLFVGTVSWAEPAGKVQRLRWRPPPPAAVRPGAAWVFRFGGREGGA